MIVYISGMISNDPGYMEKFVSAESTLQGQGVTAINPARIFEPVANATGYEEIMEACIRLLDIVDAIYMLDGWRDSTGANREFNYAKRTGKGIIYQNRGALAKYGRMA